MLRWGTHCYRHEYRAGGVSKTIGLLAESANEKNIYADSSTQIERAVSPESSVSFSIAKTRIGGYYSPAFPIRKNFNDY